jgi:hypothetical protein
VAAAAAAAAAASAASSSSSSSADANAAFSWRHFVPGKPSEFKARVPVRSGAVHSSAEAAARACVPTPLSVQARFALPTAAVAPLRLEALQLQPLNEEDAASGLDLRCSISGILTKASSSVRALYKA